MAKASNLKKIWDDMTSNMDEVAFEYTSEKVLLAREETEQLKAENERLRLIIEGKKLQDSQRRTSLPESRKLLRG